MPEEQPALSERVLQRIGRLLDQAEEAIERHEWSTARDAALAVLGMDAAHDDARAFLAAAERALAGVGPGSGSPAAPPSGDSAATGGQSPVVLPPSQPTPPQTEPRSFCDGRYLVQR